MQFKSDSVDTVQGNNFLYKNIGHDYTSKHK